MYHKKPPFNQKGTIDVPNIFLTFSPNIWHYTRQFYKKPVWLWYINGTFFGLLWYIVWYIFFFPVDPCKNKKWVWNTYGTFMVHSNFPLKFH